MAKLLRTGFEKYNTTEYYWSWNSIEGNGDGLIIQTRTGASSDRITNDHSGALMSRYLTPDFYSYYDNERFVFILILSAHNTICC